MTGTVTVANAGDQPGADVVQVYLTKAAGERLQRLIAFERVALDPRVRHHSTTCCER